MNSSFKSLTVTGWRQFHNVSIEFHPRLTIITGANGAGKSTLLNLLTPHFGWSKIFLGTPRKRRKDGVQHFLSGLRRKKNQLGNDSSVGGIVYPNGGFATVHVTNEAQQYHPALHNQQPVAGTYISSYRAAPAFQGVNHVSPQAINPDQAYSTYQQESVQRFAGNHSQGPIFRLKESLVSMAMFGAKSEFSQGDETTLENFRGFIEILRKVLPAGLGFTDLSIRSTDVVMETESGNFMIDAASGGIMSIIDMSWQIYAFSKTTQIRNAPGFTVIIDEPENHLHPSMQRTLLASLIAAFPNVQFIVATHSPFMVSSVEDSNVYALRYVTVDSESPSDDIDDGIPTSKLVYSEKLDVVNRAGNAAEILRDVLGVPVTVPYWVEAQLDAIVDEYRNLDLNVENLNRLRIKMTDLGFGDMYSSALAKVVEGK